LLYRWARAGYVVAAPSFPGEVAYAPGGPDRSDVLNQPGDVRFLIGRLLAASANRRSPLHGLIESSRIALAGHSDGGDTALAVAYDRRFRYRRIDAAIILAGADLPGIGRLRFPGDGPPLLAVQGTADAINTPAATRSFYRRASPPKYLLTFTGGGHYAPYMSRRSQLQVLEQVTIAFLDRTLKDRPVTARRLAELGGRRGISTLRLSP